MFPRKRNPVYSLDDDSEVDNRKSQPKKKKKRGRNQAGSTMPAPKKVSRSRPPEEQTAEIRREKKGRGGKTVTVIYGLELVPKDLKALAKQLKKKCGTGGAAKKGRIEIQGDLRDRISEELQKLGYKTKFIGG